MATITLSYDARNVIAKKTIAYILSLGVFKNAEKPRYNSETEKAIQDARLRKTTPLSLDDFRKQLYS
ncbi:hypothetical protein [Flavobacterium sp.]|uniref:hypothetical protein n=1 Tax=Flavobacterium sp. TaxID=239 RepID=UPI00286E5816|nr:hypothetical protein [Flavobacterium sp.]